MRRSTVLAEHMTALSGYISADLEARSQRLAKKADADLQRRQRINDMWLAGPPCCGPYLGHTLD